MKGASRCRGLKVKGASRGLAGGFRRASGGFKGA